MIEPCLAYVAQGKLHLHRDGAASTVESAFGRSLRERAVQIHNRHAWKEQGRGAQFMGGMLWPGQGNDPAEFRITVTGVSRGRVPGEMLYTLETDSISGIFAIDASGLERRILHTADFRARHAAIHPDGSCIAMSLMHPNSTASLGVVNADGSNFLEASEGDSVDLAPRWVPGQPRCLVFQSAGVGRDGAGCIRELGASTIQQLDLDTNQVTSLAEEDGFDLLAPQIAGDGTLYYIRRPRQGEKRPFHPLDLVIDVLLLPFRLAYAVFRYFSFFSMRYTGKPLINARGEAQRVQDIKRMMIWGNLVDVERAARAGESGQSEAPSLVPASWQLVRRTPSGSDVLAKNVLSFDLADDGSVLYSNGSAVLRIASGSRRSERIMVGKMIEQVSAL